MENDLAEQKIKIKKFETDKNQLKRDEEKQKKFLEDLAKNCQRNSDKLEDAKACLDNLNRGLQERNGFLKELKDEIKEKNSEIKNLRENLRKLEDKIIKLNSRTREIIMGKKSSSF